MNNRLEEACIELLNAQSLYKAKEMKLRELLEDKSIPLDERYKVFENNTSYVFSNDELDWVFDEEDCTTIESWEE